MSLYDFYVGSTATHDAHSDSLDRYLSDTFGEFRAQHVWGVWDGDTEEVAQYTLDLPTDAVAQRVATALAALTRNDAVLVSRLATDRDHTSGGFGDMGKYRVNRETRTDGNRTLLSDPFHAVRVGDEITLTYSTRPYVVTRRGTIAGWASYDGEREIRFDRGYVDYSAYNLPGIAYVPSRTGDYVAFLAYGNGTVEPVAAQPQAGLTRTDLGEGESSSAGPTLAQALTGTPTHTPECVSRALDMALRNGAPTLAQALTWVATWENDGGLGNYGACSCRA